MHFPFSEQGTQKRSALPTSLAQFMQQSSAQIGFRGFLGGSAVIRTAGVGWEERGGGCCMRHNCPNGERLYDMMLRFRNVGLLRSTWEVAAQLGNQS